MISFPKFDYFKTTCPGLRLYTQNRNGSETTLWHECDQCFPTAYVFKVDNITIRIPTGTNSPCRNATCFKMLFSFHAESRLPPKMPSGLFKCRDNTYRAVRGHLECNGKIECEDGRDEGGHCPDHRCHGKWVASRQKCFMSIGWHTIRNAVSAGKTTHRQFAEHCRSLNGSMGMPSDEYDLHSALPALLSACDELLVGLYLNDVDAPDLYRQKVLTEGRNVIHHSLAVGRGMHRREMGMFVTGRYGEKLCMSANFFKTFSTQPCDSDHFSKRIGRSSVCEFTAGKVKSDIIELFSSNSFPPDRQKQDLTRCPDNEVTHTFLSCFPHNLCGQDYVSACTGSLVPHDTDDASSIQPFTCNDGFSKLSYTLLCDFRQDCPDKSDEIFCRHPRCDAFKCTSGQCVAYYKRCDMTHDCIDKSDERKCQGHVHKTIPSDHGSLPNPLVNIPSPAFVYMDEHKVLTAAPKSSSDVCPDTHYRCTGEFKDCLPVYTRCNGWYDCMSQEDEDGCETMTCPGYYRCFKSTVCVHADHLCDGRHHCPQRDDEWLCNMTCPFQCLCRGHAFVCPQHFSAHLFPRIRYLDAQDSKISLEELATNWYIVYLRLANCSLTSLPAVDFPNVRFLDLSNNFLESVNVSLLAGLANLQAISLAKNPLSQLYAENDTYARHTTLRTFDISHSHLKHFSSKTLSSFLYLEKLNLSYTDIHTILSDGFHFTPLLTHLYMEGSPIEAFPEDLYKNLLHIRFISAQTYKLCCKHMLPEQSVGTVCLADRDELSSCEDLLQAEAYRAFLWIIGFLSLLGNLFCFAVRVCVQRKVSASGFHLFVTNLSIADLLMGIYIAIIGTADQVFRGKYVYYDSIWTSSAVCKVAGFLSLMSSEVSALTIWLITVDRFIVLRFPFSSFRFGRRSASAMCIAAWLLGLSIAMLPLLPMMSHWEFYSQTGICIPLPVTRRDFKGRMYSFSVLIVFNFTLFLLIASGQAFIYWSVQKNALTSQTTKVSRDVTIAQRLISVAVTDFLCWFPIGVCGLLASTGTPVKGEVNVALAIFVLPLNSALNPFMYTFNMLAEKRRKSTEAKLLKWLESHTELISS